MTEPKPTNINANRKEARLYMDWDDGEHSVFSFELLRNACPCAQCRGGHENMTPEPDPNVLTIPLMDAKTTRLKNIVAVGNYAFSLEWEDGHSYGIYNWHYLRALHEEVKASQS